MAIDTATKRFSMLNFGDGNTWHTLPVADSTIDAGDRAHLLDLYGGIALGSAAIPPVIGPCDIVPFGVLTVIIDPTTELTIEQIGLLTVIDLEDCD